MDSKKDNKDKIEKTIKKKKAVQDQTQNKSQNKAQPQSDKPITRTSSREKKDDIKNTMQTANASFSLMIPQLMAPQCSHQQSLFSRNEERYLSTLSPKDQKYLKQTMQKTIKSGQVPLRFRIVQSKVPNKPDILQRCATEGAKFDTWVESLLQIPFEKLAPSPVNCTTDIETFLLQTKNTMDSITYGQEEAKDTLLRLLCQWAVTGKLSTFAVALEGPAGIGKTTFAKEVLARVMNRPFNFIGLGGASDAAMLVGHSYTYDGAISGRIVDCLKKSQVMNPCLYFDELDKISKTARGDEVANLLIHITDKEQNSHFHDKYFHGIDLDISQALCCFSFNHRQDINPILLDRLNIITFKPPTVQEKVEIARRHLIPKIEASTGMTSQDISLTSETLEHLITEFTNEEGVRNLDKLLHKLYSSLSLFKYAPFHNQEKVEFPLECSSETLESILGSKKDSTDRGHMLMYS